MGFVSHTDSSMTSRYATVLSWVDQYFAGSLVNNAVEIADAIKTAGGFEAVCRKQGKLNINDNEIDVYAGINKSIKAFVKTAASKANVKGCIQFKATNTNDDFVVLIGRQNGDQIDVIADVNVKPTDFDNLIARVEDQTIMPTDKSSQLVHQVLSLGHIVEHGMLTAETVDGTKAGAKRYTERVMSLRRDAKDNAQLVVSAQYGDASAVVYVTPKFEQFNIDAPNNVFVLDSTQCIYLEKALKDRYQRRFMLINTEVDPVIEGDHDQNCKLAWSTSYISEIDPFDKAGHSYYWTVLGQETRKPFDVENCQWQFEIAVDKSQLEKVLSHYTSEADGKQTLKFTDEVMSFVFNDNCLTINSAESEGIKLEFEGNVSESVKLSMRPQDVSVLLNKLIKQDATSFTVKGDHGGVFAVFWGDKLADYAVYVPTCKHDMTLENRRVAPMRNKIGPVIALAQKAA